MPSNATRAALLREAADTAACVASYISANAPDASAALDKTAARLRAEADAVEAEGEAMDDAVQTLDRIRGAAQHCDCQAYELAHGCMCRHNGFNAARRAEEPRHD